ncbi:amidase [Thozetella sp. PMI_491]|nr:amidase [Thozetella sp. PMI_491]
MSWEEIRDAKKAEQAARIPQKWRLDPAILKGAEGVVNLRDYASSCGVLTAQELEITNQDATELAEKIAKGTYSSLQVVTAFCKRCAIGQQLCNYLTEIMFLPALEEAKKLDEYYQETGKTKGPLHGIPMTVKECFQIQGYDACVNYVSRTFNPSKADSYLIQILRAAGAVIIAKTNNPQTMMCAETDNNVFGQTKNSIVSHLTCGGSSGGEGSVIGFRGSALGVGTDIGGSIRIPAAAQGVYGFKPSSGMLPLYGYAPSAWPGTNAGVPAVCGPLAHSARDMSLLLNVVRSAQPWLVDPSMIPNIYEVPVKDRRPVVGVIRQSALTPNPSVKRAIDEAAAKLEAAGFTVKDFVPPDFAEIKKITQELFSVDGLSYAREQLEKTGEPLVESVAKLGLWFRKRKSYEEFWALNAQKMGYQKKMLDSWQAAGVDIVLCPAGPHSAVPPGEWINTMYTVCWNGVDYPAAIIPFTHVDPEKDRPFEKFTPLDSFDAKVDEQLQALFDPELLRGAPVALQLVGQKWTDAQLLRDVDCVEAALRA